MGSRFMEFSVCTGTVRKYGYLSGIAVGVPTNLWPIPVDTVPTFIISISVPVHWRLMASTKLKTVLITGCSGGGIGAGIAQELANQGHHVFATARDISKIPTELSSLSNVTILRLDVTSQPSITEAVENVTTVTERIGSAGLDVLVNNAGYGYSMPLLDVDIEKAKALYDTNVWGPVRMVQAFCDVLAANKGRVVMISSAGAAVNTPWIGAYCSSKAALTNISETMRLELAPLGISVITAMVGIVQTNFAQNVGSSDATLPSDSRYLVIKDFIFNPKSIENSTGGAKINDLARALVGDILTKEGGGMVWRGYKAGSNYFLTENRGLDVFLKSLQ
ncbi:hypothetical protein HYALB_00008165 [Hymenoscyphus albidus]|uniref:NAD(P)-binding protein n=1 Tax=Hymenoscyphus albidus TaxID=595503 RepID=A0A9N9Q398_9HELO|nr:hypothetical protein HYALB_00008165 [Hymenoscyphus albidus]